MAGSTVAAHSRLNGSLKPGADLAPSLVAQDAEPAVLGALIVDGELMGVVDKIIVGADFHEQHYASLYDALRYLYERGEPIDKVSVAQELRRRNVLDEVGGLDLLTQLLGAVPTTASVEYYARIVRTASDRRKLLSWLRSIALRVTAGDELDPIVAEIGALPIEIASAHTSPAHAAELRCIAPRDVLIRRPKWLMLGRIPLGEFQTLDGEGGIGKTTAVLDVIAAATAGLALPDGSALDKPLIAIVLAEEDSLSMLKARLIVAGADLDRVRFVDDVQYRDGRPNTPFSLPANAPQLERLIRETGADIVYIDSLFSHFDVALDSHRSQDARAVCRPLADIAHTTGAAILATRHWAKTAGPAASRGLGSADIRNVARSVISFGKHPMRFDDEGIYVAAVSKSNCGPRVDALLYRIEPTPFKDDNGEAFEGGIGRIVWLGTDSTTADEIAGPLETSEERSDRSEAREMIVDLLSSGAKTAADIEERRLRTGIAKRTLERARRDLRGEGVIDRHGGGVAGSVYWSLAARDAQQNANDSTERHRPRGGERGEECPIVAPSGSQGIAAALAFDPRGDSSMTARTSRTQSYLGRAQASDTTKTSVFYQNEPSDDEAIES